MKKNYFSKFNFKCTFNTPNCVELNSKQLCHSYFGHLTLSKKLDLINNKKMKKYFFENLPKFYLILGILHTHGHK